MFTIGSSSSNNNNCQRGTIKHVGICYEVLIDSVRPCLTDESVDNVVVVQS